MKAKFENSWASHPGFEPRPSVQQAGILPLDHSAAALQLMLVLCEILSEPSFPPSLAVPPSFSSHPIPPIRSQPLPPALAWDHVTCSLPYYRSTALLSPLICSPHLPNYRSDIGALFAIKCSPLKHALFSFFHLIFRANVKILTRSVKEM